MSHIISSQSVRIQQAPASIGARFLALLIDCIVIFVMYFFLIKMYQMDMLSAFKNQLIIMLIFITPLFYPLLCEIFMNGQTLGKRAMRIRVVTLEGGGPKITSFILRWFMLLFDTFLALGIGELCIFFTKRQQRLGDILAGTWVVRTQTNASEHFNLSDYNAPKDYTPIYPRAKNLTPQQASLIAEVLDNADNHDITIYLPVLKEKIEAIIGPATATATAATSPAAATAAPSPTDYLTQVLTDYRNG